MKKVNNSKLRFKAKLLRLSKTKNIEVPADLRKALSASSKAKKSWEDITPIARRDWVHWIILAKQSETRRRRIKNACSMLASGKRRVCCFPGVKWLVEHNKD